jgi:hypothetical protein
MIARVLTIYDGLTLVSSIEEQPDGLWAAFDADGELVGLYENIRHATVALRAARGAA